jgi:3-dehydroquinate synthase
MITIKGRLGYSYSLKKTANLFSIENNILLEIAKKQLKRRFFILIDKQVHTIYGEKIKNYFHKHGIEITIYVMEGKDYSKNQQCYLDVFKELCFFDPLRKDEPLLAIGGGVITDLGGFVASTYRRGIPHIKIPTTLMGYVDASVGIKTGINFGPYKNRMGSFTIPEAIILDKNFLRTLDERNIISGIGEIIKLAVILDPILFELLEKGSTTLIENKFQNELGEIILDRSIEKMVDELSGNLYETILKRKVDFGHTFSLMLESTSNYEMMHGEAVALDILYSCCISYLRGLLKERDLERIVTLYKNLNIPTWSDYLNSKHLWTSVNERIMHRNGKQLIPIPVGIGHCKFINDLSQKEIQPAIDILKEFSLSFVT